MHKISRWLFVVAATLVLAACGGASTADEPAADEPAEPEGAAGPFILDGLPEDVVPVVAGEGDLEQDWGTEWGSHSPFIVVQQGDRRVRIEARGIEYPGEIGPGQFDGTGSITGQWRVSGRMAGDDIALQATSLDVDTPELDRLLEGVAVDGRRSAPSVEDLPDGWEVVGHSDADIVMSMSGGTGPSGGYGASWVRGDRNVEETDHITAVNLPGDTADLSAWVGDLARPVSWFGDAHGELTEVDGREAVFILLDGREGGPEHLLLSRLADDSLLILTSSGNELLSREQLVDLAASARPATEREWTELGWSTWGGPDLQPDDDHVEVGRGEEDGQEWLLQATQTRPPDLDFEPHPPGTWFVDPCLKLIGGERACATNETGGILVHQASGSTEFPDFYLVSTDLPGAAVRVTTRSGSVTGPLLDLPDGSPGVAVVFVDAAGGIPWCSELPAEMEGAPSFDAPEIDVIDADGAFVGCASAMFGPP